MRSAPLAAIAILGLGLLALSLTVRSTPHGPSPSAEHDVLRLTAAYWSKAADALILVREQGWARIDLRAATEAGKLNRTETRPLHPNSFTLTHFRPGAPEAPTLAGFVAVPVLTGELASFGYTKDGEAWHARERRVAPPGPLHVALYRGKGGHAGSTGIFWGSYVFAMPEPREDGRRGVEFFYHPAATIDIRWHAAPMLLPYGPSLLAVSLLVFCLALRGVTPAGLTLLALVAAGLHGFSTFVLLFIEGWDAGWSGGGNGLAWPALFGLGGFCLIGVLTLWNYATPRPKA